MKIIIKKLTLCFFMMLFSCTKKAPELMEIAQTSLDQNLEDQAIDNLNFLLEKYPNDSLASLAQYKLATIYKSWKNDPKNLLEALNKTVNKYPDTPQATQAKKEIQGFQDWIINNAETLRKRKMTTESIENLIYLVDNFPKHELAAKAQYIIGDIYMNDLRDFEKALSEYRAVLDKYNGSNEEALAQFMIGYIYANVIKDFDLAKKEYQIFLDKFPKHELHPSVKFEIDYLGKDINEIPALKHITS